ncbi:hypothetical protein OIDMADRAFT_36437 [Oidiodendron maius Zn]|uniref:Transcription factor domain-containing protein n=1 Tax=Oidiodendron maius (strain Zn) TaxID=913774 RepID=A0A0C3GM88_OIDMZ|nr:hypothetical protein OIDMADRAFT_36437 [Oidiodendron maius Zn]
MEQQSKTRHAQPLAYHFVGQVGSKIDESTRSGIRSHAMKEVRNKQRQQKQVETMQSGQQSVIDKDFSLCQGLPVAGLFSASSKQNLGGRRIDVSSALLTSISDHCYRCRAQLFELTPSQQRDDLLQPSSSMATVVAADFNPFNSMTGLPPSLTLKFSDEIDAIKSHAIAFCYPGTIEALQSQALLASILYMTYSYLCSERGWGSLELALCLKVSGNSFEEVQTHLNGLEIIITHHGMESLGISPFGRKISKYLFVQHLLLAALRAQPAIPMFDLYYSEASSVDSTHYIQHESPLYCPENTFDQLLQSKHINEDTVNVLYNAKALIDLVIDFDDGVVDEAGFSITFKYLKNDLEYHISTHDPRCTSTRNWIFECCRLTVVIVLRAIETGQSLISSDSMLTPCLITALEKTGIGDSWGELSGVLYWVSIIGSASSQGKPGHRLLDSTLGRIMSRLAFTASDFSSAVEPVRQFSRLQMALKRRSQVALSENPHN